jgi:signal transduction histidine kinase
MILDRLLVRHKLNLLVAVPLMMVALLAVPLVSGQVAGARQAGVTAEVADTARRVSALVEEVQRARLLTVAYLDAGLVSVEALTVQFAAVADARAQLLRELGPDADPALLEAVRDASMVTDVAPAVTGGYATDHAVLGAFNSAATTLILALRLDRQPGVGTQETWTLSGLGALLQADEAASESGALLLMSASNPALRLRAGTNALEAQAVEKQQINRFVRLATPAQVTLLLEATRGPGAQRLADASAEVASTGAASAQGDAASHVFAAVQSQTTLRQMVEASIAQEISLTSRSASTVTLVWAAVLIGLGLLALAGVVLLTVAVGRSVSVPLRRLTHAAGSVVDVAAEELANVADDDADPAAVRRLAALPVGPRDELGELAEAFNRVQVTTAALLERQVASRRNVAAMFAGIGRRTSNLVGRQLAIIDVLESAEEDSATLRTLYRLDHIATRLRRNASSLVVLSGEREVTDDAQVVSLPDAVRAALGSIEDFQRVALTTFPEVHLSPAVSADVMLILSELIENAVLFSPPRASVEVGAWPSGDDGYQLLVVDHGIGMPAERLAEENARLRQRERLDLAPTDVLGLFVVGRVSRRHGIEVTLEPTPEGGLTVRVALPMSLFVDHLWSDPAGGFGGAVPAYGWGSAPELPGAQPVTHPLPPEHVVTTPLPVHPLAAEPQIAEPLATALTAVQPVAAQGPPDHARDMFAEAPPQLQPDGIPAPAVPGVRRRIPGTHWEWEGPVPVAVGADDQFAPPDAFDRSPASRVAEILDGAPLGLMSGDVHGPPDPEATRRQVEDLEAAMAGLDPSDVGYRAPAPPVPQSYSSWVDPTVTWDDAAASGLPPPPSPAAPSPGPASPGAPLPRPSSPGPSLPRAPLPGAPSGGLVRRVPGATLASLGVVLSESAAPVAPYQPPMAIDPEETLRVILDVDEAVRRARAQVPVDDGYWATDDAVSRWGGREEGGGR